MMKTQLDQIAKKAKLDPKVRFTSLAHLLTPEFLTETWGMMNRSAASGIDGQTARQFERDVEQQVAEIHKQLTAGRYRAPPVRRVEIPKGPGRPGHDRWEFPRLPTGSCNGRLRAYWKLSSKRTSSTAVMASGLGEILTTHCRHCACTS